MPFRGAAGASGIQFGTTNTGDYLSISCTDGKVTINTNELPQLRINGIGLTLGDTEPTDKVRGDFWITGLAPEDIGGGD